MSKARPENIYIDNFKKVIKELYHLTPIGFNEVSSISYYSYQNFYRKSWYDIVKDYNEFDKVYNYIKSEILKYYKQTGFDNFKKFCKQHKYITENIVKYIDLDFLLKESDLKYRKQNRTLSELMDNFNSIKDKLGHIPSYTEFNKYSKITHKVYNDRLNIKISSYDEMIKYLCSEIEYNTFKANQKEVRRLNADKSGIHNIKYTDEELSNELIIIFDNCKRKYNVYPSRRYFNKISKCDVSAYKHRFKMNWTDICKMYGYDIQNKNSAEYIVLGKIKNILQSDYIPQKKWDWLRGIKKYPLRVDGYFEQYNLAIEFDGRQHDEPIDKYGGEESFKVLKSNDQIKDILIPEHGIKLIRISAFSNWFNDEFLREELLNIGIIIPELNSDANVA